jgi:hypothetical protein
LIAFVLAPAAFAPGVSRAGESYGALTDAASAAFKARLEKLEIVNALLWEGELPVFLMARNDTTEHLDLAALARRTLPQRMPQVDDVARARAIFFVTLESTVARSGDRSIARVTAVFELVALADQSVLAALAREEVFVNGTKATPGKERDAARAELSGKPTVGPEALARTTKGLAEGLAKARPGFAFRIQMMAGDASTQLFLVATIEEAVLAAGRSLQMGYAPRAAGPDLPWKQQYVRTYPLDLSVVKTKDGLGLEIDGVYDALHLHVGADGALTATTASEPSAPQGTGSAGSGLGAKVAAVKPGRVLLSVGTDDRIAKDSVFEIWRGARCLATATVDEVDKDGVWAHLTDTKEVVLGGDEAHVVWEPDKPIPDDEVGSAVSALVKELEALPLPVGKERRGVTPGVFALITRPAAVRPELERAIKASKKLALTIDGLKVDGRTLEHRPRGTEAVVEAVVLTAKGDDGRVVATGAGRAVTERGAVVPREGWREHFAHAFGPAEDDGILAALTVQLATAKLGGSGQRPLALVLSGSGGPVVGALVDSALNEAGMDIDSRPETEPDLRVDVSVESEPAKRDGKPGVSFRARVVVKRGEKDVAIAETRTWKPD